MVSRSPSDGKSNFVGELWTCGPVRRRAVDIHVCAAGAPDTRSSPVGSSRLPQNRANVLTSKVRALGVKRGPAEVSVFNAIHVPSASQLWALNGLSGRVFDQTGGKFAPPRRGARGRGVSHHRRSFRLASSCWLNLTFCGEGAQRLTQIGDRLTGCFVCLESGKIDTPGSSLSRPSADRPRQAERGAAEASRQHIRAGLSLSFASTLDRVRGILIEARSRST